MPTDAGFVVVVVRVVEEISTVFHDWAYTALKLDFLEDLRLFLVGLGAIFMV